MSLAFRHKLLFNERFLPNGAAESRPEFLLDSSQGDRARDGSKRADEPRCLARMRREKQPTRCSTVWQRSNVGGSRGPPTIDPARNYLPVVHSDVSRLLRALEPFKALAKRLRFLLRADGHLTPA